MPHKYFVDVYFDFPEMEFRPQNNEAPDPPLFYFVSFYHKNVIQFFLCTYFLKN